MLPPASSLPIPTHPPLPQEMSDLSLGRLSLELNIFQSFPHSVGLFPSFHLYAKTISGTPYTLGLLKVPSSFPSFSSEEAASLLQGILGPSLRMSESAQAPHSTCLSLTLTPTPSWAKGSPSHPAQGPRGCPANASG